MQFQVGDVTLRSEGSVGFDETVAMVMHVPIQDKWIEGQALLVGLKGQSLAIPISGTLRQPKMDQSAVRGSVAAAFAGCGPTGDRRRVQQGARQIVQAAVTILSVEYFSQEGFAMSRYLLLTILFFAAVAGRCAALRSAREPESDRRRRDQRTLAIGGDAERVAAVDAGQCSRDRHRAEHGPRGVCDRNATWPRRASWSAGRMVPGSRRG